MTVKASTYEIQQLKLFHARKFVKQKQTWKYYKPGNSAGVPGKFCSVCARPIAPVAPIT